MARLPSGFQELSYIESTGTQYIDTLFKPNNNTTFEMYFSNLADKAWIDLFGTVGGSSGSNKFYCIERKSNSNNWGLYFGSSSGTILISANILDKVSIHHIIFNDSQHKVFIDDKSASLPNNNFQSNYNFLLFGLTNYTGNIAYTPLRVWSAKLWDNSVLLLNLIPAKRLSDGAVGMYDLVSQSFFGNSGTGEFIAGAPIIEPTWGSGLASVGQKELLARRFELQELCGRLYLYRAGDECVDVTGGWTYFRYNDITKYPDHIHIEGSHGGSGYGIITTKAINLSGFHKICLDTEWAITSFGASGRCGISTRLFGTEYVIHMQQNAARGIRAMNIPRTGSTDIVYQCFGTLAWSSNVYNIWLE